MVPTVRIVHLRMYVHVISLLMFCCYSCLYVWGEVVLLIHAHMMLFTEVYHFPLLCSMRMYYASVYIVLCVCTYVDIPMAYPLLLFQSDVVFWSERSSEDICRSGIQHLWPAMSLLLHHTILGLPQCSLWHSVRKHCYCLCSP